MRGTSCKERKWHCSGRSLDGRRPRVEGGTGGRMVGDKHLEDLVEEKLYR